MRTKQPAASASTSISVGIREGTFGSSYRCGATTQLHEECHCTCFLNVARALKEKVAVGCSCLACLQVKPQAAAAEELTKDSRAWLVGVAAGATWRVSKLLVLGLLQHHQVFIGECVVDCRCMHLDSMLAALRQVLTRNFMLCTRRGSQLH